MNKFTYSTPEYVGISWGFSWKEKTFQITYPIDVVLRVMLCPTPHETDAATAPEKLE